MNDAPTIRIVCTHCQTRYRVARTHLGKSVKCKRCGETFVVAAANAGKKAIENTPNDAADDPGEYRLLEGVDQQTANNRYADQTYLSIRCPLCRTLIRAPESAIGEQVKCPDCYKMVDVALPPKPKKLPSAKKTTIGAEYRLLDGVAQPDAQSLVAHQEYLSFKCPVCQTRIRAAAHRAGELIRCPDCGEPVVAPLAPTKPAPRSPYANRARPDERMSPLLPETDDSYALSPQAEIVRSNIVPAKPEQHAGRQSADPEQHAEQQPEEDGFSAEQGERKLRPPSANPFAFLRQGQVATRWLIFALVQIFGLRLVGNLVSLSKAAESAETLVSIGGLVSSLFLLEGLWLVIVSANLVALVRETSAGVDKLQHWTAAVFLDWMGDFLFIVVALTASVLPGAIICQVLQAGNWVQWAVVAPISAWLGFPVFFLAALDAGGPFTPTSKTVYRSLRARPFAWIKLYLASGLLWSAAAGLVFAVLSVLPPFGILARLVNPLILTAALLVYFRWLGVFACGFVAAHAHSPDSDTP